MSFLETWALQKGRTEGASGVKGQSSYRYNTVSVRTVLGFLSLQQNTTTKDTWGEEGLFSYTSPALFLTEESQDRDLNRQDTDAEAVERCCLLVGSSWAAQPAFL